MTTTTDVHFSKALTVSVGKVKDVSGRRIVGHFASLGEAREVGPDPKTAIAKLQNRVESLIDVANTLPLTKHVEGFTFVLIARDRGYLTILIQPGDSAHGETYSGDDVHSAESSVRLHIAQLLYPDRERAMNAIRGWEKAEREFAGWAEFQDRYRWARQAGCTDVEAHNWAGRNPACSKEFFEEVSHRIESLHVGEGV